MSSTVGVRNLIIAWASVIVFGIAWGATIPLLKIAVSTGHHPLGLLFWQLVIGALALGAYLLIRGQWPVLDARKLLYYLIIALIGTIIPGGIYYIAANHLPGGVLAILIATVPMFTLAVALGLRLEQPSLIRLTGVLAGFAAMAMLALPDSSLPEPGQVFFVGLVLISSFSYASEANYVALCTPSHTDPVSTLFFASVIGLLIIAPATLATGTFIDPRIPWGNPEYALIASSLIHAFTYCAYIWLVGYAGPVFSVQIAYPVTLSGIFFSMLILNETYSGWIWAALITVITGLALVQPRTAEPAPLEGSGGV